MESTQAWRAWAEAPFLTPDAADAPSVEAMPALSRRRLNRLGRMVAEVCYSARPQPLDSAPIVLTSRYGDAGRSLALLADLDGGHPVSPTAFGLSVHNAIGAMVSITRSDRANATAIAAGRNSAVLGLVDALAQLLDPMVPEVTLVYYDEPLPFTYQRFQDEAVRPCAWAWQLGRPRADEAAIRLRLDPQPLDSPPSTPCLPTGMALLRFGIGSADACALPDHDGGGTWTLTRTGPA